MSELSRTQRLSASCDLAGFDSGNASLDDWLKRFALINQKADSARTYVVEREGRVVGYYALTTGGVDQANAPPRIVKGLARHPIGVILLARLAVDRTEQGRGLGKALLKDALVRIAAAVDIIGARAVLVRASDENARRFYERFGFARSPTDELQLWLLMKDLRASLRG